MYVRDFLLISALLSAAAPGAAQTVSGRLLDASTRQPIAAGRMSLLDDGDTLVSALTDSAGNFRLRAPRSGDFRLRAERLGYRTAETPPIELAEDDTLRVEFRLSVDVIELNPITVIGYSRPMGQLGGFYERAQRGMGVFVTRADIEARSPLNTTDLLRTVPGVSLLPAPRGGGSIVRLRGGCNPRVYLDGLPIQMGSTSIDALIRPHDLEGIEVYRGPGELPVEFGLNACGAIVLWTRRGD